MYKKASNRHAFLGMFMLIFTSAVYAAPTCDSTVVSAFLPTFRMPADVQMAWTENAESKHVSSLYFMVHSERYLNRSDPNGLAQIFQAQLEMRGWVASGSETEDSAFTSLWTITDSHCGSLQISFNLV